MQPTDLPERLHTGPIVDLPESVFVADGARVMGDVRLGEHSSVWYNAVLRGDINHITIGERSNIQDGCVVHVTNDLPCIVGDDVTVGHAANLHACTIDDGCLIGIGAIVLSGARIGTGCVVGAGALVRENEIVEPFSLVVGVPARRVRELPSETLDTHRRWARKYVGLARAHRSPG